MRCGRRRGRLGETSPFMKLLEIVLALLLPPVAVLLRKGVGTGFVLNLLRWVFLIHRGGVIHAFWVLTRKTAG